MKQAVRNIWIDALRSGAYEQGAVYLRNFDDEYTALGVLAELAVKNNITFKMKVHRKRFAWEPERKYWLYGNEFTGKKLNQHIMEWSDLTDTQVDAVESMQMPFEHLADWIEDNL